MLISNMLPVEGLRTIAGYSLASFFASFLRSSISLLIISLQESTILTKFLVLVIGTTHEPAPNSTGLPTPLRLIHSLIVLALLSPTPQVLLISPLFADRKSVVQGKSVDLG